MTLPARQLLEDPDDNVCFDVFFSRWYPSIVNYARRFGDAYAEEIAQETLFRAFKSFADLRRDMPLPWLRTVARNVACDIYRSGKRLHPLQEPGEHDPADPADGPEEALLRWEQARHVRAAFGDMSAEDRQLLQLSVLDQASVDDIADLLAVTSNAVRVRLHRARRRLGTHYLKRAGHGALAVPALILAGLRRLLRPSAEAVGRGVPALATVATLSGLAATGIVLSLPSGTPVPVWGQVSATEHPVAPVVLLHSKPAAHVTELASHGRSGSSTIGSSASGPVGLQTHFAVRPDTKSPGTVSDAGFSIPTPVGPVWVDDKTISSGGDGVVCKVTGQTC